MAELARIGSRTRKFFWEFDKLMEPRGYATRSEAVRDPVCKELVDKISTSPNAEPM